MFHPGRGTGLHCGKSAALLRLQGTVGLQHDGVWAIPSHFSGFRSSKWRFQHTKNRNPQALWSAEALLLLLLKDHRMTRRCAEALEGSNDSMVA